MIAEDENVLVIEHGDKSAEADMTDEIDVADEASVANKADVVERKTTEAEVFEGTEREVTQEVVQEGNYPLPTPEIGKMMPPAPPTV